MMDSYGDGWNGNALVVNGTSWHFLIQDLKQQHGSLLDCNVTNDSGGYVGETLDDGRSFWSCWLWHWSVW